MGIAGSAGITAAGLPNKGDAANAVVSGQITGLGPTPAFAFRGPMNLEIYASINTAFTVVAGSLTGAGVASATGLAAGASINSSAVSPGSTIGVLSGTTVTIALSPRTHFGTIASNGRITGNFPTDRLLGATVTVPSNNEQVTLPANTTVTAILQAYVAPTATSPGTPGILQLSNNPTVLPPENNQVPFLYVPTGNSVLASATDAAAIFTGAGVTYSATVQLERSFDGGATWVVCNIGGSGALAQWAAGTPVSLTFGEPEKNVLYRLNAIAYASGTINYRISQTGGAAESLAIGPLSGG